MKTSKKLSKSRRLNIIFGVWLIGIFIISMAGNVLANSNSYNLLASRGTQVFNISEYNADRWDDVIGSDIDPDDWFEGESDVESSESKTTIRSISELDYSAYEVLTLFFNVLEHLPEDLSEQELGMFMASFQEEDVNDKYTDEYSVWELLVSKWKYTNAELEESPDNEDLFISICKDPANYADLLEIYNSWIKDINTTVLALGIDPYPALEGEDILWEIIKNNIPLPLPLSDYVNGMIDALEIRNAESKEGVVTLEKKGNKDYVIQVSYNEQGLQTGFKVYDENDNILYEIESIHSGLISSVLIGILAAIGIISAVVIFRKRQMNKKRI